MENDLGKDGKDTCESVQGGDFQGIRVVFSGAELITLQYHGNSFGYTNSYKHSVDPQILSKEHVSRFYILM